MSFLKRILPKAAIGGLLIAIAGLMVLIVMRSPTNTPVQNGMVLAQENSCFSCHGPGGTNVIGNPWEEDGEIPQWDGGVIMMYAETEEEIREWITFGMPKKSMNKTAGDGHGHSASDGGHDHSAHKAKELAMPAYKDRLSKSEIDELVELVKAISWFKDPEDELAFKGREIAEEKGCFGCHGPMGWGGGANAKSFKGHVPAWTGKEYKELLRSDEELEQWIMNGRSDRFANDPIASWFLDRATLQMPAYREKMTPDDFEAIKAYIMWLNS